MSTAFALFTDGSLNPQRRLGIGAALLVPMDYLSAEAKRVEAGAIAAQLVTRQFHDTSSTKLEVETVLWALQANEKRDGTLTLFTDSQCVAGLKDRRSRLEASGYISGRTGRSINNAALYQDFFTLADRLDFTVQKVSGHSDYRYQDTVHRIFHYVDREARRQLKQWLRELAE